MRSKLALTITAASVLAFAASSFAAQFNANTYMPDSHPLGNLGYHDFAKDLRERTNGAVDFKVFAGGVLVPPRASLSAIGDNIAQIGFFAGTYTPKELPIANLVGALAFENTDPLVQLFAVTEFSLTNPAQLEEWQRNRVVFGGGYATPPYNLFCTSEIRTLDDMRGKKLRMPGGVYERWARHLGAVSVNVSSNEMYTGLEKGALDCAANANDALKSHSLWEVAKFTTLSEAGVYYSGAMYAYNPTFWAKLTPEQRKTLFDTMAIHMVRTTVGYEVMHNEILEWAKQNGVKVIEPAEDMKRKTAEFVEQERKDLVTRAEQEGLRNAESLVNEYLRLVAKWDERLTAVDRRDEKALVALLSGEIYGRIDPATYGVR